MEGESKTTIGQLLCKAHDDWRGKERYRGAGGLSHWDIPSPIIDAVHQTDGSECSTQCNSHLTKGLKYHHQMSIMLWIFWSGPRIFSPATIVAAMKGKAKTTNTTLQSLQISALGQCLAQGKRIINHCDNCTNCKTNSLDSDTIICTKKLIINEAISRK